MRDLKPREYALLCEATHATNGVPNPSVNSLTIMDGHPDVSVCLDLIIDGLLQEIPPSPNLPGRSRFKVTSLGYSYLTFLGKSPEAITPGKTTKTQSYELLLRETLGAMPPYTSPTKNALRITPDEPNFFRVVDMVRQKLLYVSTPEVSETGVHYASVSAVGFAYLKAVCPAIKPTMAFLKGEKARERAMKHAHLFPGIPELTLGHD